MAVMKHGSVTMARDARTGWRQGSHGIKGLP